MLIADQEVSFSLFGDLPYFRNVKLAAGYGCGPFGGLPCDFKVAAQ